ncbi:unnamed protein product, partial [Didymodactylos carnosus]
IRLHKQNEWLDVHTKKLNILRSLNKLCSSTKQTPRLISSVKNLSKRTLSENEIKALENGLDYVYPSLRFDEETFISNIETCFVTVLGRTTDKCDYDEKDSDEDVIYNMSPTQLKFANKMRNICDSFRYNAKRVLSKFHSNIASIMKTLKNLAKDKSIVITKPDKGRGIVIMDRNEYLTKMNSILSDVRTFKEIKQDPTIEKEDQLTRKLLQLKNDNFITVEEYKNIRPTGSQPGRIYGLPKIHKVGNPLRPIVSAINTYNYKLSLMLANKLEHLRKSVTLILDTFSFVKQLHELKVNTDEIG